MTGAEGRVAAMRSALAASAFLFALSFVAGCGGDEGNGTATGASPEQASFAGVPWRLVSGLDVAGVEASPPSATFENTVVGGSTGCNHYSAPVTIDADSMKIGMIAATQMACAPPADSVERAYLDALGQVVGWRMDGSALVLVNGDGDELLRYEAASPVGDWEATSIQTGDALASPLPGTTITGTITPADVIGPTGQGIAPGEWNELAAAIRAGVAYANVHSTTQPAGEIRGQINDNDQRN